MIHPVPAAHFFERALVDGEVCHNVRLLVNPSGFIDSVNANQTAHADDRRHAAGLAGMPNTHSHAHQYALAGRTERASEQDDNFWSWRTAMYRFVARMEPEQLQAVAAQLYVDLLKGGYTSVGEFHYVHHDRDGAPFSDIALMSEQLLAAAQAAGIGITVLPVLYRYGDFAKSAPSREQRRFINDPESYLRIVSALGTAVRDEPLQSVGLAPHSLRAVSPELLAEVLAGSPLGDDAPVHIHVAEQTREVADARRVLKKAPVEFLLDNFDVDRRWCLIHATHMSADETERLAQSGAVAGICPTTEANLGDGLFPTHRYCTHGGQLAVGSDSNVATDAVGELRLLEYVQRLKRRERNVLAGRPGASTGEQLLTRAQVGGAQALGQAVGSLSAGRRADFVTLNTDDPMLIAREQDVFDAYVFAAGARAVRDVYVAGQQVIDQGHHAKEDEILRAFRAALETATP
ncbi:MAG: formimidoylglutamate deiminase [Gammaproteobacteria bacterium]